MAARRHLVLVGLSGSGKTSVGRLVAAQLDTHFTDIDQVIERATGLTVSDLFEAEGETSFREREQRAVLDALVLPPHVIAAGGGWAAQPGNLAAAGDRVTTIYLCVLPRVAAGRLDGVLDRPLVAGGSPVARLSTLLAEREGFYRSCDVTVDADADLSAVVDRVVAAANEAGW